MTEKTTSNAEAIEAIQRSNEEAEKEAELECIRCGKVNRIKCMLKHECILQIKITSLVDNIFSYYILYYIYNIHIYKYWK
jgi:hypothetical protein